MHDRPDDPVRIGKVGRAHGVRGEVRVFTDHADSEALSLVEELWLERDDSTVQRFAIERARRGTRFWIVKLAGVDDRDVAAALTHDICLVERDALPELEDDDVFYAHDLVGLRCIDLEGSELGEVVDIFDNGAHLVLVFRRRGEPWHQSDVSDARDQTDDEMMVPFVDAHVGEVDLERGTIEIRPFETVEARPPATNDTRNDSNDAA